MIVAELIYSFTGMSVQDGIEAGYRNKDGSLTALYLDNITISNAQTARIFEIYLNKFHYEFPFDGNYKISWKIEKIED